MGRTRHESEPAAVLRALEAQADAGEVAEGLAQPRAVLAGVGADRPVLVLAHTAHVQLEGLPGTQPFRNLLRKHRGIACGAEGVLGHQPGGLVIAVTVARVSLEAGDQHQRAVDAHDPDHLAQDVLLAPLLQGLVEPFGEAVIDDAREVLLVDAVVAVGQEQLLRADEAEAVEQLGADRVVSRLPPVQREESDPRAQAAADPGQDPAVLVVRVGGRVHRARRRPQLQELLPGAGGAPVGAQRARRPTGEACQQRADPDEPRFPIDHAKAAGG